MKHQLNRLIEISKEACRFLSSEKNMFAKDIAYDLSKAISALEKAIKDDQSSKQTDNTITGKSDRV
jgi:hypothetical protein